ncbi:uncharacterized protein BDZ99DRAFT_374207 [Mytilinidion resinicola]|uniref:Knr4/Smi1-like domain-containing protein n=1 Tax=Mytilinidion resinicola TaxID=574789 RepID=A0A6A6ZAQ2_9PEZI|nr:uncharacterized protein BDZ99DRAFT_374207 [Mytilinidion resinicola]KAF2817783.1 hypothetical protein BDZ99DRAFT_374207 [Mytilinidion resinicola]
MTTFADETSGSVAMDKSSGLVRALDLRIKLADQGHVDEDKVPSVDDILGMIASRMHANSQIDYLAQSARAWKILKDGALAKAVGVDDKKVQQLAEEVEKTFKLRLEGGRQRRPERSMLELLQELAHNTVHNPSSREDLMARQDNKDEPDSPFDGREPATPEEIAELEKRLKITLPDDYKEFLRISNGFGNTWGGILHNPPLHPTTDVDWFGDDEDYFYDLPLDLIDSQINYMTRDYPVIAEIADDWPTVGMAIDIGNEDIDSIWLLPPANVEKQRAACLEILDNDVYPEELKSKVLSSIEDFAGSLENFKNLDWCCLTWASGGSAQMDSYSSFKDYIATQVVNSADEYYPHGKDENYENICFAYSCR